MSGDGVHAVGAGVHHLHSAVVLYVELLVAEGTEDRVHGVAASFTSTEAGSIVKGSATSLGVADVFGKTRDDIRLGGTLSTVPGRGCFQ